MRPRFAIYVLGLAGMAVIGHFRPAEARVVRVASATEKVIAADTIVVGQVVAVEDKDVEAEPHPGAPQKLSYRVVSLKVDDPILGAKGLTHLRVGFVPRPEAGGGGDGGEGARGAAFNVDPQLRVGQEGCFFLARHPTADFLMVPPFCAHTNKKAPDFAKQVEFARRAAKLLADPSAGLKARDADDRFLTAALLVQKYRNPRRAPGLKFKEVPVEPAESRLIVAALIDADWSKGGDYPVTPMGVMFALNPQADGFRYPKSEPGKDYTQQVAAVAKAWFKERLDTYRVKKLVPADPQDGPK